MRWFQSYIAVSFELQTELSVFQIERGKNINVLYSLTLQIFCASVIEVNTGFKFTLGLQF